MKTVPIEHAKFVSYISQKYFVNSDRVIITTSDKEIRAGIIESEKRETITYSENEYAGGSVPVSFSFKILTTQEKTTVKLSKSILLILSTLNFYIVTMKECHILRYNKHLNLLV